MSDKQPSEEFQLPAELAALEEQLAELAPAAVRVDRDRLMFAAGRAAAVAARSEEPGARSENALPLRWFWPAATALTTAASIFLAAMLAWQRDVDHVAAKPQVAGAAGVSDAAAQPATKSDAFDFDQYAVARGRWPWSGRPTSGYLALRYVALTEGVGAIGEHPAATNGVPDEPPEPATVRELLDQLLPMAGWSRKASS